MPAELEVLKMVTQLGSFGLLVYMAIWGMPKFLRACQDELKFQRKECAEERNALRFRIDQLLDFHMVQGEEILAALQRIKPGSVVRGQRPSRGPRTDIRPFEESLEGGSR